jgi:dTDP-4-dehydrorhamnose reductase
LGKNGQIGWELERSLSPLGEVLAVDRPEIDFMELKALTKFTLDAKPDLIVNAAAYTDVDQAESEPEIAMRVNGEAPGVLAEIAKKLGVGLVHYSTDYVFDGTKGEPYTEEDEPNPINVYGETKLVGDRAIKQSGCAHLILRTSWVYGARGRNFFLTVLALAKERDEIRIVDDQFGSPTWSKYVAQTTAKVLSNRTKSGNEGIWKSMSHSHGLYNCGSKGEVSWFDFAREIILSGSKNRLVPEVTVSPIPSSEFSTPANRPSFTPLTTTKLENEFQMKSPFWRDQLLEVTQTMQIESQA